MMYGVLWGTNNPCQAFAGRPLGAHNMHTGTSASSAAGGGGPNISPTNRCKPEGRGTLTQHKSVLGCDLDRRTNGAC